MRYLFAFLFKHYFFFLFLFLEVISFMLLANYNRYHSSVILSKTSDFTGAMHEAANNVSDYFMLKERNRKLADENAALRSIQQSSLLRRDTSFKIQDSLYRYATAEIVTKSVHRKNNYFMIDKGSGQGVQSDMGVISRNGVLGIVTESSNNYSIVMPLIHKDAKISAVIEKNNQLANMVWEQDDYRFGTLKDIPVHVDLSKGDTILTSGYSFIFPAGILIGTIEELYSSGSANLKTAKIRYSTDFNSIDHVYVIQNLMRNELDSLKTRINE